MRVQPRQGGNHLLPDPVARAVGRDTLLDVLGRGHDRIQLSALLGNRGHQPAGRVTGEKHCGQHMAGFDIPRLISARLQYIAKHD